jgi:hypothetical protein
VSLPGGSAQLPLHGRPAHPRAGMGTS